MSKHGDKHVDRTALFPSSRHLIRGLVGFSCEKNFRDRGSGFVVF